MQNKNSIALYYDEYSRRQLKVGVNKRHKSIMQLLRRHGLKKHHDVLEIGCGIGTQSGLILDYLQKGSFRGLDISSESVRVAKDRLRKHKHGVFQTADISEWKTSQKFDVVVLPDVLEHIPMKQHNSIFVNLYSLLKDDGFIFIHIPDPVFLDWLRMTKPESLQIIDQSIPIDHFSKLAKQNELYITNFYSYEIWHKPTEYQVIVMRKIQDIRKFSEIRQSISLFAKIKHNLIALWRNKQV